MTGNDQAMLGLDNIIRAGQRQSWRDQTGTDDYHKSKPNAAKHWFPPSHHRTGQNSKLRHSAWPSKKT
jgi:hypothetical protein